MVHRVALDRSPERVRIGLVHELRRVRPDHDQLVGELLLYRAQLVEDVQAVDAAEGPEVEQHEASAELAQGQRAGGVEPAAAAELGGAHAWSRRHEKHCPCWRDRKSTRLNSNQ